MKVLRTITDTAFGVFAVANLATPLAQGGASGVEEWVSKLGALGLCAFMVFQNYRQSDAMTKILAAKDHMIQSKDEQIVSLTRDVLLAMQRNTEAVGGITEALRNRPCIVGDRRFDEVSPDAK